MAREEKIVLIKKIKEKKDPFVKAKLIKKAIKEKGLKLVELGRLLKKEPSYLCHLLRLNKLPDLIIDGYYSKLITLSHLFVISRLKDEKKMIDIYEQVLTNNLTVLQTEELIREEIYKIKTKGDYLSTQDKKTLTSGLNKTEVSFRIDQSRIKSKVTIIFKGNLTETTERTKRLFRKIKGD